MAQTHDAEKVGFAVSSSSCQRYFGFLSQRSREKAMPEECLTCTKMLDCMFSKPEAEPATAVPEPKEDETVVEEVFVEEPSAISEQAEDVVLSDKQPAAEIVEPDRQPEKQVSRLDEDFCVESTGTLYNQWDGTVLISSDTLLSWGKKIKEVEVQTRDGKKATCRVYGLPDLESRVVQVPSKIKEELGIGDGSYVTVRPLLPGKSGSLRTSVFSLMTHRPRVEKIGALVARGSAFAEKHHVSLHDVQSQVRKRLRRRTGSKNVKP